MNESVPCLPSPPRLKYLIPFLWNSPCCTVFRSYLDGYHSCSCCVLYCTYLFQWLYCSSVRSLLMLHRSWCFFTLNPYLNLSKIFNSQKYFSVTTFLVNALALYMYSGGFLVSNWIRLLCMCSSEISDLSDALMSHEKLFCNKSVYLQRFKSFPVLSIDEYGILSSHIISIDKYWMFPVIFCTSVLMTPFYSLNELNSM